LGIKPAGEGLDPGKSSCHNVQYLSGSFFFVWAVLWEADPGEKLAQAHFDVV
jgi:hypothetical protein